MSSKRSHRFTASGLSGWARNRPPCETTAGGPAMWKRITSAPIARASVWATRNASSACAEKSVGTRIFRIASMGPSLLCSHVFVELPAGVFVHEVVGPTVTFEGGSGEVLGEANLCYRIFDELVLEMFPEGGVLAHHGHVRLDEGHDPVVKPLDRGIVLHRVEGKLEDRLLVVGNHHRNDLLSTFQPNVAH